ncbi:MULTISPECIES: YHS domain-containing (seleno)protein [unclassified Marinobacter]|uniref:YHS domain-containing (seleno)protein n=1 Tax=unclassified Marinobacter TaxID=83889 RepID=UPI00273BEE15|nr:MULTISPECIES: YHS domain-containing (seleno)protein [unclassified Marinobacter]MDP4547149.1 YHS domain-containing (seleno)protein [Marinobacter sp. MDS2]
MTKRLALFTFVLCVATGALAAEPAVYTGLLSNTGAGGYDTVSYFETGKATKGSGDYTTEYQGATWRFANAENLARFEANPEYFAPAYGGYCAWAVAQGYLAKGDPQHWTIRDDRLYLNYSQSIQDRWLKNPDGFIQQANANWPSVLE